MIVINKEAFTELVHENMKSMYRLAYSILQNEADAEDAVGEAILKAYEKLGSLRQFDKARAWLMQITANTAKTMYKRRKWVQPAENCALERQAEQEKTDEIWDVVQELTEEFRTVIILYYYEELKIKEIAAVLKIPEGTVKTRLLRGKQKLAKLL